MTFRQLIKNLSETNQLVHIRKEVSTDLEAASVLAALGEKPTIFEKPRGFSIPLVGGLCSSRELVAKSLNTTANQLITKLANASKNLSEPQIVENAACQEQELPLDLDALPLLKYMPKDGGRYIPSAISVIRDPDGYQNVCFHRLMQIGKNKFAARIVENRGTDKALKKAGGELDIAICIGNSTAVLLAAATTLPEGVDELTLANTLEPTPVVRCKTTDINVPAECEIVMEGRITKETAPEGPFLDLTTTYDKIRQQPVIEIKKITSRKNPYFQVLLPGKQEHRLLMGMPKEHTIYNEVSKICKCRDVFVTPGGGTWLHAVVQIEKRNADDGKKAAEAAFRGHHSMKHCIIVDDDINIYDPVAVEWAIATRFQADRNLTVLPNQPGSSLDPSADLSEGKKATTCKVGIDATIPFDKKDKSFKAEKYAEVELKKYL